MIVNKKKIIKKKDEVKLEEKWDGLLEEFDIALILFKMVWEL